MLMEHVAEVLRGWPGEGALEMAMPIKAAATLVKGDVVEMQSDGTVDKVSATPSNRVGLVVKGNGDSASASKVGMAVVLWSGYVVRVSNAAGTITPGTKITGKSGVFTADAGSDPIVGYCIKVTAASSTETASVTIVVP
jgi:predicted RecA/RadA family phage recombinase